jgi:hypothetical protein
MVFVAEWSNALYHSPKYNNMLVDRRRGLEKSVLPWGIAVQIKETLWQKLLIIIGIQIPIIPSDRLVLNSIE